MNRSFDPEVFREAVKDYPEMIAPTFDFKGWLDNPNNVMYVEDDNVGLCTYEYKGVYTVHWYYKTRGRAALRLAVRMLSDLFENHAKAVRGLTNVKLKAACWAARQIGMKSQGIMNYPDGDYELFCMTKQDLKDV
jgi:hypothetical protein